MVRQVLREFGKVSEKLRKAKMLWQTSLSYEFGPFRVDAREQRLVRNGEVVPLRPKVFDVLLVLVQNSGHILSKDEMMRLVWPNTAVEEGNIARNISTLRNALGERSREPQYIETVPWRGYRFVANVKEVPEEPARPSINSIAVLPFINVASEPNLEYLADGIAETLINNLSQLAQLKVMSRNATFRYEGREMEASAIGRDLSVQAVLMGRVAQRDDLFSISVELVDARDDSHIWGAQYIRKPADIFTLQETIAQEIAEKLRLKLTGEQQQRLTRRHTENAEAYHLYLKGRYYFNKLTVDGVQKGIEHHKQAIEKDPHYALAYTGLGDCYNYFAQPVEAKQAVSKALELNETLGEAHASLGFYKFVYDWDFAGAQAEFKQALVLNPNYAEAHHWSAIYFANIGRHEEAAVAAKRAVELDPLSLLMNISPGLTSYLARDYARSATELRKVIDMEPNFPAAHSVLGNVYLQQGLFEQAMAEYQNVLELSKGVAPVETSMKAVIGHAYAKSGKRRKAMRIINELTAATKESDQMPGVINVSPHSIAEIHAALGQIDEAFAWLDKAHDQHDMQLVSLKVNPTLDSLRSDARFADLGRRVGLPQEV
ncbi:MAG: winged helix-turn-helix domain-containing protein [Acidobacteria bacterium]|nr:winged helix-turn-helix domain-containing protein [Acidobacteriota bacterium]